MSSNETKTVKKKKPKASTISNKNQSLPEIKQPDTKTKNVSTSK